MTDYFADIVEKRSLKRAEIHNLSISISIYMLQPSSSYIRRVAKNKNRKNIHTLAMSITPIFVLEFVHTLFSKRGQYHALQGMVSTLFSDGKILVLN